MSNPVLRGYVEPKNERSLADELALLDALSRWMDSKFRVPGLGWRFGLDAILGLIPGIGDTATSFVSLYILAMATRFRVPRVTLLRMSLNIAIDYVLGSLPLVGDAFDVWWKSNLMNMELLRRHADFSPQQGRRARTGDWLFVGGIIVGLLALLVAAVSFSVWLLISLGRHFA